jgi:hypothetical protein
MAVKNKIPNLPRGCGSWVVVSKETGEAVLETYSKKVAQAVNQSSYDVVTALEWLYRINQRETEAFAKSY